MKNPIIVLAGPTASGKTSLSFDIAKKFDCEIICADSMTVYRGLDIGTGKPTLEDKDLKRNADGSFTIRGVKHHLIDVIDPDEEFNVTIFIDMVQKLVDEIHSRGKIPLLVGGSVMFIDAFVYKYDFPEVKPDTKLRAELEKKTNDQLYYELIQLDPDSEWTIDKNNQRRLVRALEVSLTTGRPFSEQKTKSKLPANILYLAVERVRDELYNRINQRVDEMFAEGFVEEVRELYRKYDGTTALQAAGYKQIIQYLNNEISLEEAIEKTKQVHRNYAKRQLTWLRRNTDVNWITDANDANMKITEFLR